MFVTAYINYSLIYGMTIYFSWQTDVQLSIVLFIYYNLHIVSV
jgi:hypothetical protein